MMKIVFLAVLVFGAVHNAKATVWYCESREGTPQSSLFFDSATETLWLDIQGQRTDLITQKSLSSWKMPREKCDVQASFDRGEKFDLYSLSFRCGYKLGGSLQIDFLAKEAFYREDLYQGNTRHLYYFDNCRLSN